MAVESVRLVNTIIGETLELDMVTTQDYVLEQITWGEIQSTHHSYKYVSQVGESVTGTTLETREVELAAWVIAKTDTMMSERKRFLNRFFNPVQPIDLYYKEYVITFLPNTTVAYASERVDNNEVVCKFKMTGFCPDPLWTTAASRNRLSASTMAHFHFPLALPNPPEPPEYNMFGERRTNYFINVENDGDLETGLEITFRATTAVVNPRLLNENADELFGMIMTLHAGEEVYVNTNTGSKQVRGRTSPDAEWENYFKYKDLHSKWLTVQPGVTRFRVNADSNIDGLSVTVRVNDRFLEVQQCY